MIYFSLPSEHDGNVNQETVVGNHTFETDSLDAPVRISFGYTRERDAYTVTDYERIQNGYWVSDMPSNADNYLREEITEFIMNFWNGESVTFPRHA